MQLLFLRKSKKDLAILFSAMLAIGFCIILSLYFYVKILLDQTLNIDHDLEITLERGNSSKDIIYKLHDLNVLKHPYLLWLYIRFIDNSPLLYGQYSITSKDLTTRDIINKLKTGDVIKYKITFPEGYSTQEIYRLLESDNNLKGDIDKNLYKEGHLLPETYNYIYGVTRNDILIKMHGKLESCLEELWQNRAENLPYKDKEEALTMASIIEKEAKLPHEKSIIASVFINRIIKKMPLQADPTVEYAITLGRYKLDRPLNKNDLKIESPYNTYYSGELPPSPICNPGAEAIKAAFFPKQTSFLYFVVDGKGGHNFAATLKEHNINVLKYKKGLNK